jgi:hypothetical protein
LNLCYVGKVFTLKVLWPFAKKNLIRSIISSTVITSLYFFLDWTFLAVPFLPIGTIGTAVAFYVGFKIIKPMNAFGKPANFGEDLLIIVEFLLPMLEV